MWPEFIRGADDGRTTASEMHRLASGVFTTYAMSALLPAHMSGALARYLLLVPVRRLSQAASRLAGTPGHPTVPMYDLDDDEPDVKQPPKSSSKIDDTPESPSDEVSSQGSGAYVNPVTGEIGGPKGPEPTRYGDWENKGRVSDF